MGGGRRAQGQLWTAVFTKLTVRSDLVIHEGGEIAWAMRKDSPQLLEVVNEFTKTHKIGTTFGNMLKKRYLGSDSFRQTLDLHGGDSRSSRQSATCSASTASSMISIG